MAQLPDGTFYKVAGLTLTEAQRPGGVAYPFYQGASLQAAEKHFDETVQHCLHPESSTRRRYMGLNALPRVELRFYQPDGKTYRVVKTWREDAPCQDIYRLLGRVNRPKALACLYGEWAVSDREHRAAEQAADELAPLLTRHHIQLCYREDNWAYWHGHDCQCPFKG